MYMYTCTYIYTYIYKYIYMYMYICTYVYECEYVNINICPGYELFGWYMSIHVCMTTCIHIVYVYIFIYIYAYIHIYIYTHTHIYFTRVRQKFSKSTRHPIISKKYYKDNLFKFLPDTQHRKQCPPHWNSEISALCWFYIVDWVAT